MGVGQVQRRFEFLPGLARTAAAQLVLYRVSEFSVFHALDRVFSRIAALLGNMPGLAADASTFQQAFHMSAETVFDRGGGDTEPSLVEGIDIIDAVAEKWRMLRMLGQVRLHGYFFHL